LRVFLAGRTVNRSFSALAKITLVLSAIVFTAVLSHPGVDAAGNNPMENGLAHRSWLRVPLSLIALVVPGTGSASACEVNGIFSVRSEKHSGTRLLLQVPVSGVPA
jgi:hypothetical protein